MDRYLYPAFLAVLGLITCTFIALAVKKEDGERRKFMTQCLADRKEYECIAMWRSGSHGQVVVPVFIPTGGR